MHEAAYNRMNEALDTLHKPGCPAQGEIANCTCAYNVLDVGALDLNGTYRPLVEERGWKYTGLDIVPGPNVDVVGWQDAYVTLKSFDIVISGSTMEHVKRPWDWIVDCVAMLKLGGRLIIITHHNWVEHRHPIDCWRFLPDGMKVLFDDTQWLHDYFIEMYDEHDIIGMATKWQSATYEGDTLTA